MAGVLWSALNSANPMQTTPDTAASRKSDEGQKDGKVGTVTSRKTFFVFGSALPLFR